MEAEAAIILSHETALVYWQLVGHPPPPQCALGADETKNALARTCASVHAKQLEDLLTLVDEALLAAPLDILVGARNDRRNTRLAHYHCVQMPLPDGTLYPFEPVPAVGQARVYIASPELCFVQMTRSLDELGLVELGFELCATYRNTTALEARPVTTPHQLQEFACRTQGLAGVKPARRLARYVLASARSQDVAHLAMLAHLPRSLGGFGMPAPQLDATLAVPQEVTRMLGTRMVEPDLFWPRAPLAVEYDSRIWRDAQAQATHNARKASAYTRLGLQLVTVSHEQAESFESLQDVFNAVQRACHIRRQPPNEKQLARMHEAHGRLFG